MQATTFDIGLAGGAEDRTHAGRRGLGRRARLVHTRPMARPQTLESTPGDIATLAPRVAGGDVAAEAEIVARYSRGVRFLLRRMARDPELAEDLHQETFRVVLERLRAGGLDNPQRLDAFVHATARNLFIGDYRKRLRRDTHGDPEHLERTVDSRPGQLSTFLRREKAAAVRRAIRELDSERDRQLLYRFYIAEDDKDAICADLGLSSLHFNRVLFRARQRMKEILLREGAAN